MSESAALPDSPASPTSADPSSPIAPEPSSPAPATSAASARGTRVKNPADLGRVIRQYRRKKGLTQRQLADRCGCSIMYLSNLERGKETAELGIAMRIVNILGLNMNVCERGGAR